MLTVETCLQLSRDYYEQGLYLTALLRKGSTPPEMRREAAECFQLAAVFLDAAMDEKTLTVAKLRTQRETVAPYLRLIK